MTYFGFLLLFIGPPLALLVVSICRSNCRRLNPLQPFRVVLAHIVVAVLYTTPWDNYLVATRVWWYAPDLVTGLTLGWVPIEEYTFFIVQTLLTGMWLIWLAGRIDLPEIKGDFGSGLRWVSTLSLGLLWSLSVAVLISGWQPATP